MLQESSSLLLFRVRTCFYYIYPDSQIAKKLTIGKTKTTYNIAHRLSLCFHNQVDRTINC